MKNNSYKLITLTVALILLTFFQPAALRADDTCRGIGGTGHASPECGIGGTGNQGIGGTGITANNAGIGGTGHSDNEGGIGGTGIVGIITKFGSIWVNGLEVQYDMKTPVAENTMASNTNSLAIGQVVTVEASGNSTEFKANKISVVNAVAGQISARNAGNGNLTVLGQDVAITAQTIAHDQATQKAAIKFDRGDYVKVSGLRLANGTIVASRIERTAAITAPSLVGPVTAINGKVIEVYGQKINVTGSSELSVGQEIAVTGQMNGDILSAATITPSPSTQLYGRTAHINLQGYVGARNASGQIQIGNMEIVVPDPAITSNGKLNALTSGDLIQVSGHFANDHRIIADKVEFSRDRPDRVLYDVARTRENTATDRAERTMHIERQDRNDHADRLDRNDHVDRPDKPDRSEHSEIRNNSERSKND